MGSQLVYILIGTFSCMSLLYITFHALKSEVSTKNREFLLSAFIACFAGIILSALPFLSLSSQGAFTLSTEQIPSFGWVTFANVSFLFAFLFGASFAGVHKMEVTSLQRNSALYHFFFSALVSAFFLASTYITAGLYLTSASIDLENSLLSLTFVTGGIYCTTRIFEHLYTEEIIMNRSVPMKKYIGLLGLVGLSFSSTIYSFIERLYAEQSVLMTSFEWKSAVVLYFVTLVYIETQFKEQQELLEHKNRQMEDQEQHYRSLFEYNPNAVFTLDTKGNFTASNQSAIDLTGYTHKEMMKLEIKDLVAPNSAEQTMREYQRVINGGTTHFETTLITKSGQQAYLKVTGFTIKVDEKITGVHAIAQDITQEKLANEQIEYLAYRDELTGLLNRRGMNRAFQGLNQEHQKQLAVVLFDVDLFKNINDHLGHYIGDQLLKEVGDRLLETFKGKGFTARMGGDEFLLCLDHTSMEQTMDNIRLLQKEMNKLFTLEGYHKQITLSIGVSYFPGDGTDFNTLVKRADMAMYEVKSNGRNGFQEFSDTVEKENIANILIEEEMRKALDADQYVLHFQPKMDLRNQAVAGVEALIRWEHPDRGLVMPGEFIPIAEQSELIVDIGRWTIRECCRQYQEWVRTTGMELPISVNISSKQFLHHDFIEQILTELERNSMPPHHLDIEITETLAIENKEVTQTKIESLKDYGITISMDDFGTGYTSLSYLSMFSIDRLKIDRTFIQGMVHDSSHAVIVDSIVSVARHLDMVVTAEGVETNQQLEFVKNCDCDEAQGYLFGTAIPADHVADHLLDRLYQ
ncbi:sensor domain-containing protein [Halobacillus salinus]|uniref:sensor domain-containing protein n=1 Tax=Halobacillus salinus TaxID=192814 RepID=UPI001591D886|nr:EAL domain-containing protein [Halobacillus salinus]